MTDSQLFRVRGVDSVAWAVPLYKGSRRAKARDGTFRQCVLLGVDDATLTGAVRKIVLGSIVALKQPNTVILDQAGYDSSFPGEPLALGRTLEMNDHRVVIGGISDASAPFATFPVVTPATAWRCSSSAARAGSSPSCSPHRSPVSRQTARRSHQRARRACTPRLRAVLLADDPLLPEEHRHSGQLRHHHRDRADRRHRRRRPDVLHLHDREPEAVRGAQGHRRHQPPAGRDDRPAGPHRGRRSATRSAWGCAASSSRSRCTRLATRGITLLWQNAAGVAAVIFIVVILSSLLSIRKVVQLEPAVVFRG